MSVATTTVSAAAVGFQRLSMRGVTRIYGKGAPALSELDLELGRGEFVALLGPSGCGKSTALACLAGLQPLSGGSIWRDDERIDTLPPEKRGFGMVFQNYALFPHMSVQKNVEFGLSMRRVEKAQRRRRALDALRLVHLQEHAAKLPAQLSGGQQQRVAIARALAIEPEVVLMDEPLSNLDAALRVEMRTEIKRLYQERGLTVLYVTHDQEEALSLATRLVVLRKGVLEQTGTPQEVYTNPASAYVAGFMGYRNLFPARVEHVGPGGEIGVLAHGTVINGTVGAAGHAAAAGDSGAAGKSGTAGASGVSGPSGAAGASGVSGSSRAAGAAGVAAASGASGASGASRFSGEPAVGAPVTVAVRPEDLVVGSGTTGNAIRAVAEVVEYHGRELSVQARTEGGGVLHLKTDQPVVAGNVLTLGVPASRVLVYPGHPEGADADGGATPGAEGRTQDGTDGAGGPGPGGRVA